jgi:hypothetical protein
MTTTCLSHYHIAQLTGDVGNDRNRAAVFTGVIGVVVPAPRSTGPTVAAMQSRFDPGDQGGPS